MTREEKQKAIDALEISLPTMAMTQEKFNDYIQTLNKIMDWLEQESTTKNDLGVDCISRDSAIKALDYGTKYFEFKSGISKYKDDIAKIVKNIYETQVNNIKALPSVTPQEPKTGYYEKDMTNSEKFTAVFGFKIDEEMPCGFFDCSDRTGCKDCPVSNTKDWWNSPYRG